jgi:uncharacterized membrane protein
MGSILTSYEKYLMNPTHLHLAITHLPIFGTAIGLLVLLYGIYTGSYHTKMAAYAVLVVAAIGGIIAFSTGEAAEETVESLQGIVKRTVEEHEEFAETALIAIIASGVASLTGAYITWKQSKFAKAIAVIVLIISLICLAVVSWTGYLGGQIRHTETGTTLMK